MKLHILFKHVFIPHKGNNYKPHLFRELSLLGIVALSFFLFGISAGSSFFTHKTVLGSSIAVSVLIDLTNENRIAYNELPLVKSDLLEQAASLKAEDMVVEGYFAHNSPKGLSPWHWLRKVGYVFLYAGENLAVDFTESADVENGWINSPTHKANLLNSKFTEIGIATKEGVYEGNPTIFVVQMFGTPAKVPVETGIATIDNTYTEKTLKEETSVDTKVAHVQEKATTTNASTSTQGEVMGDVIEKVPALQAVTVINNQAIETYPNGQKINTHSNLSLYTKYSKWYERAIVGSPQYVGYIYTFLIILIEVAILILFTIEVRKRHWRHIFYGFVVIGIITLLAHYNAIFF